MLIYVFLWFKKKKQHIRMISEGSCNTENWSNGYWKFSFAITYLN